MNTLPPCADCISP